MLIHMCWGCSKAEGWTAAGGYTCTVYAEPMKPIWARHNLPCPFNKPVEIDKGARVRVGQQKQKKGGRR